MEQYLIILKDDNIPIPKQIRNKLQIKSGDLLLIKIEKAYGKENMPKDRKVILL